MSDDVFESFGDDDIFAEEEELEQPEGEGQNRTFIIAVAALGGLLLCALAAFGVWAFVLNKPQEAAPAPTEIAATSTLDAAAAEAAEGAGAGMEEGVEAETETPAPTETASPTDTPEPTATPLLGPTATPTPEAEDEATGTAEDDERTQGLPAEGEEGEEAEATTAPRRTATPTSTPRPTATPRPNADNGGAGFGQSSGASGEGELSQTGLGEWLLVGAALLFVGVMIVARKLRHA